MKPAAFDYYRPGTVQEALELLGESGDEGKLLAGGQSLVPILNMRLSVPGCLIDMNGLHDLSYIRQERGWLKIGAMTRQRDIETSRCILENSPLLSEAVPFIGHAQTRNRGTVGGSVVHADPTAELPLALLALGAKAVIASAAEGNREVDLSEFFITYLTTDILPGEMLTEIKVRLDAIPRGYSFVEYSRKHGDFALVASACVLDTDARGRITSGRLTLGGVDTVPIVAQAAVDALIGEELTESLLKEAGAQAASHVDPEGDLHASREYRLHLAGVFAKRAIQTAYERAIRKEELIS